MLSGSNMFTEHDKYILKENRFTIFPAEDDGYAWAMTSNPILKTVVMRGQIDFFIKICTPERESINNIARTSHANSIEEVIIKAKQMQDIIESDWLARGRYPSRG